MDMEIKLTLEEEVRVIISVLEATSKQLGAILPTLKGTEATIVVKTALDAYDVVLTTLNNALENASDVN